MAGTKRAAEDETNGPTTRSAKAPKTEGASPKTRGRGGKRGPKVNLAASAFKSRAMPLHVNITHTPPPLPDAADKPEGQEITSVASVDPGFVGTTTLVPSTFATGSYGWKGSKRVTIELPNQEGVEGEKEKVHVMLTINATVMGSKGAKEETGEEGKEEQTEEHVENGAETKENDTAAKEALGDDAHAEEDITEAAKETTEAAA